MGISSDEIVLGRGCVPRRGESGRKNRYYLHTTNKTYKDSGFESHVTNFYSWSRDKLNIGKFCQIAAGVEFVMNDANYQMNAVSTFLFYTFEG